MGIICRWDVGAAQCLSMLPPADHVLADVTVV